MMALPRVIPRMDTRGEGKHNKANESAHLVSECCMEKSDHETGRRGGVGVLLFCSVIFKGEGKHERQRRCNAEVGCKGKLTAKEDRGG